nr:MAG TPA: hypothetical protein [Caudoviricetes sp.]
MAPVLLRKRSIIKQLTLIIKPVRGFDSSLDI